MRVSGKRAGQQGFALIIALWVGVLLSVIAAHFVLSVKTESRLAGNLVDSARAVALADAGIHRGILALLADGDDGRWIADGRAYDLPLGDGSVRIRLRSESARVDLNAAPEALIHGVLDSLARHGVLESRAEAASIADAILDWRDTDSQPRPGGAEDRDYEAGGYAHGARDGEFLSVAELEQVLGVTPQIRARLTPWFTVYSRSPLVEPNLAPRELLLGIPGLDSAAVDRYLEARDALHAARADAPSRLPTELLSGGAGYLSQTQSRVFTVEAEGVLFGGAHALRRAVIELTGREDRPYAVIAWFDATTIPEWLEAQPEQG